MAEKLTLFCPIFFSRQSCEKNITHSKKIFTFLKKKRENSICPNCYEVFHKMSNDFISGYEENGKVCQQSNAPYGQ